jgi:pSer/pThr/pTyr-binding forkhead associated (FHA) protein
MDEPLVVALKFGFLAVLYLFLIWVARSALKDLGRGAEPAAAGPVQPPGAQRAPAQSSRSVDAQLVVVAAKGYEPGTSWNVDGGVTMGRSEGAEIRVDDQFASSSHARLFRRGDSMWVEDMGSTNGTYLNGRQISAAEPLKRGDVIRIGDSEYRYQE